MVRNGEIVSDFLIFTHVKNLNTGTLIHHFHYSPSCFVIIIFFLPFNICTLHDYLKCLFLKGRKLGMSIVKNTQTAAVAALWKINS